MSASRLAVHFTPEIVEELHSMETAWPFSNEAAISRARQLRPGWYWVTGWVAGARIILTFEPFAEPGRTISVPWRVEFDRWFRGA